MCVVSVNVHPVARVFLTCVGVTADASVIAVRAVVGSAAPPVGLALAQVGFIPPALRVAQVDRAGTASVGRVPFRLQPRTDPACTLLTAGYVYIVNLV